VVDVVGVFWWRVGEEVYYGLVVVGGDDVEVDVV